MQKSVAKAIGIAIIVGFSVLGYGLYLNSISIETLQTILSNVTSQSVKNTNEDILSSQSVEKVNETDTWVGYNEPIKNYIDGKYNATVILMAHLGEYESGDIVYYKNGVEHRGYYVSAFVGAMNYIKNNTPENSTILCWWDYGNMVIGYGERRSVVVNPSRSLLLLITLSDNNPNIATDPEETIQDTANALTATDPKDTVNIMKKYGSEYLLVPTGIFGDEGKAKWIFYSSGISLGEMNNYWLDGKIVGNGVNTILYKMLNKMDVDNFKLVFSDNDANIYQVIS
ncbi:MAG TPA: hypothetical protein VIH27_00935 [Nitrososphaerales archaeon]